MTAPVQPWRWIRLEIGLIVNGGIQYALFIDHPLFWPALGLTTLLILLLLLWPSVRPASPAPPPRENDNPSGYWREVSGHVYALLPLWAGHISLGREQIDDAAAQLTTRFDGMLRQLNQLAATASPSAPQDAPPDDGPLDLLQRLPQLVEAGRQLETLAQSSAAAQAQDGPIAEQAGSLRRQLEALELDVRAATPLRLDASASAKLQAAIEDILTQLQFQDRVSQILSHVQNDIWQLETTLHEALHSDGELPAPPDTEVWLAALKSSYTTHEQRALHNREHNDKTPGSSDITFF
ncbi:hypothetical protein CXB49_17170 [Chromobacterium sp. ATCC 53434]|uniref:hypothetical protein n=1 Tax=Chromobacterium TaxID=535 RepID=UPI000C792917|nr:hypothetical protein [Chromobacterium sp. ATCC 53434]AUH52403.1 hypothetical protein CXB49_17170 [Chromobacterium sp. ATCC 53434]